MSDILDLHRFAYTPLGTFGHLYVPGIETRLFTVERPWIKRWHGVDYPAGAPFKSCIPEGLYVFEPYHSPTKGLVYRIVNPEIGVYPNKYDELTRYAIEMHPANTMYDVVGCIGPGDEFGPAMWLKNKPIPAVYNSRNTFELIQEALGTDTYHLHVRQYRPFHA